MKRNVWFALRRPADRARTGLLWIWPARGCCVFIGAGPHPRIALLRLRVDPQFFTAGTGHTVFAATLSATQRKLWIEDVLMWKGREVVEQEPFTRRWQLARQWLEHYCILDPRLLGGLDLELAQWQPLTAVQPDGVWEFQSDAPGRRLLWIARHTDSLTASPALGPVAAPSPIVAPKLDDGPLVAVATRASGPEQWMLASADGVSLGRALVRTLTVSTALRAVKGSTVRVEVDWQPEFQKWEVRSVSGDLASHSAVFAARKPAQ